MNNSISVKKQKNKSFVKTLFIGLIIVMTINHLANNFISLIDTFCISNFLGDRGLTAIGLVSPITQIVGALSQMFAVGGQLVATKFLAKGDSKSANRSFASNTIFLFLLGIVLAVLCFFISTPLASALSAGKSSADVISLTSAYLKGFVIGFPFLLLNSYLFSLSYLDNDKKRSTGSIIVLFATNIILDFTFASIFKYKAFGIGLASSIAYMCSCILLATHFISKKAAFKFNIKAFKYKYVNDSFTHGIPVGVKNIFITARIYLLNFIMLTVGAMAAQKGLSGDLVVAAHGIESNITNIFECGLGGLIETILMLGAVFYSEEDEKNLNELLKEVFKFAIIIGGILSVIYFFTAPFIASLYSKEKIVVDMATYAMRANALAIILMTLASSFLSFLQATKRSLFANLSTTLQSFLLPISWVTILGLTIGIKGIWIGIPLGFVTYVFIHLTIAFIKNKKVKFDVRTLFFLPKEFGYKENEIYEKEINGIKDVYSIQNDVYEFCNKLNIDSKRKENLSNAAEELATLIIVSGFTRTTAIKHKPHASIKVLFKKNSNDLLIRTRDNCDKFDIKQKIKELEEGKNTDLALNCSLKILLHISKDIEYSQLLKTNNMIIKI